MGCIIPVPIGMRSSMYSLQSLHHVHAPERLSRNTFLKASNCQTIKRLDSKAFFVEVKFLLPGYGDLADTIVLSIANAINTTIIQFIASQ